MKKPLGKIGYDVKAVKKMGKTKFLETFKDIYPDTDLNAEWDKISSPPKKEAEEAK